MSHTVVLNLIARECCAMILLNSRNVYHKCFYLYLVQMLIFIIENTFSYTSHSNAITILFISLVRTTSRDEGDVTRLTACFYYIRRKQEATIHDHPEVQLIS